MTKQEKQAIRNLMNNVDVLLTNMADCGDYEDSETGEIRSDVNQIEKAMAELSKLVLIGRG